MRREDQRAFRQADSAQELLDDCVACNGTETRHVTRSHVSSRTYLINFPEDYLVPILPERAIRNCEITAVRLLGTILSIVRWYIEQFCNKYRECHEQAKV